MKTGTLSKIRSKRDKLIVASRHRLWRAQEEQFAWASCVDHRLRVSCHDNLSTMLFNKGAEVVQDFCLQCGMKVQFGFID